MDPWSRLPHKLQICLQAHCCLVQLSFWKWKQQCLIVFRAPPVVGVRADWKVLAPRRRWFQELEAVWDDLLRVKGVDFSNVTASSSIEEHWCRNASVAIFNGQRVVAAEKSKPDRNKSHKTFCMGSSAGCKAKCFPICWLKSASDSTPSNMFEIASIFSGANSFKMWRGEARDNLCLNSSTVAFSSWPMCDSAAASPPSKVAGRSPIRCWFKNSKKLFRPNLSWRRWVWVFSRRAKAGLFSY